MPPISFETIYHYIRLQETAAFFMWSGVSFPLESFRYFNGTEKERNFTFHVFIVNLQVIYKD